jgi:hypothetical protein
VSITPPWERAIVLLARHDLTLSTDLHNWDGENPYHEAFAYQADLVFLSATALGDRDGTLRRILPGAAPGSPSPPPVPTS